MTINEITNILNKYNLFAKQKFGQNFLLNESIIENIVSKSNITKDDFVIEIGPGLGFLTKELCKYAGFVLCYEIDSDMINVLEKELNEYNNVKVILQDFLKCNIDEDINRFKTTLKNFKVVSNLPYYITTKILLKILEESKLITESTCMMQKEVADRICGIPKTKDYNALSVLMQYYTNPKVIINVSRNSFYPIPDVDSSVVSIIKKETITYKSINEEYFKKFNRIIFNQRRKTLSNNLKSGFGYNNDLINKVFLLNNIKSTIRSEELSVEEIVKLSDSFYKESK